MQLSVVEESINCPFCGENISILLDLSAGGQSYIEDCQVCCRPMQISFAETDQDTVKVEVDCAS